MLTFEEIKELIELVASHSLSEVEVKREGFRVRIEGPDRRPAAVSVETSPPPTAPPVVETGAGAAPKETSESDEDGPAHQVTSPIVGTFYAAPSPDSDPFVRTGQAVSKGDVLCIVEAMKLMNEIECDVSGVIREVYPKNGQAVEFGEPLFGIDPDS